MITLLTINSVITATMDEGKQTLLDLLEKIAKEQKYVNNTVDLKAVSAGGSNITSALFLSTIRANDKPDLKLFAKVALLSDHNGKLEIVLMDFQLVLDGDPLRDLLYFIFTATDEAFRRSHYHAILDLYHERLSEALRRFQIDVETVYSESTYRAQLEEYSMVGLTIAVILLPLVLVEEEDIPNFDDDYKMTDFVVQGSKLYKERLNGVINNYVEWGLL
ncbi:uncharacterized protein LOC133515401 isoform X2 [Cydia pomonella]|uniref:uncharacterized protein LOC133515401 isoform X2 n=1 Tax=Cydia pomonella TaxID=82600 RepID=UPI002ADDF746|nr:uncharacterized protein LOC133515401 isoform X2 [Cydia pomonella]